MTSASPHPRALSEAIRSDFREAYEAGKRAAYDHAANVATHRYFLSRTLGSEAADALFQALPDAIRALSPKPSETE